MCVWEEYIIYIVLVKNIYYEFIYEEILNIFKLREVL